MKKTHVLSLVAAVALCLPFTSYAKSLSCPFTDYFSMSAPGSTEIIGSPYTQGNLKFTKKSDIFFTLSCGDNNVGNAGDLFVNIGSDTANFCSLVIHDGPFEMNPTVTSVSCKGALHYSGIDHVFGSYNYTLKFT